ncbi:hypothetical protein [Nitrosospira lacus]|nr:hypothetical protein [Nitrosospira lacus]
MMARQVAWQLWRWEEIHRASGENGRNPADRARVGWKSRRMDYLGS